MLGSRAAKWPNFPEEVLFSIIVKPRWSNYRGKPGRWLVRNIFQNLPLCFRRIDKLTAENYTRLFFGQSEVMIFTYPRNFFEERLEISSPIVHWH